MGMMNYFVLFSLIIIATCAIVLLIPSQPIKNKGTNNKNKNNNKGTANKNNKDDDDDTDDDSPAPSAAGQRSLSSAAGAADGSSDHQHLLDTLLQKHDALVEGMQNDDDDDDNYGVKGQWRKWVGCSDKCVKISDAADALGGGNCVNPPISDTNSKPDYSKRHCMAFAPPRGKPYMRDLECMTCGYYTYEAECKKTDPDNSAKCKRYGNYTYKAPTGANAESYYDCSGNKPVCDLFLKQRGGGGGGQDYADDDGPVCSASNCKPKEVVIADVPSTTKCVIPGCMSNSGGLPYPKDFYGTDNINPCKLKGNEYICPAVTSGSTDAYNSGGSSGDPCYTTGGKVDVTKFQSMNQMPVCNSVRPRSTQNFKPGDFGDDDDDEDNEDNDEDEDNDDDDKGDDNDDNDDNDKGKKGKKGSQRNNNNGSVINVYHHYVGNRIKWSSYKNPESGLMYLGIY